MGDQPNELYPGHAAEVARMARRRDAIEAANAEPLPGPLLDAFAHVPEKIGDLTVRPLVHYDFVLLRKLESPLLAQMKKTAPDAPPVTYSDEQAYEMIYQFTHPIKQVAAEILAGREAFQQRAVEAIGMTVGPMEVGLLVKAVEREFVRYFSTAVKYGPKQTDNQNGTQVFPAPPAAKTASAGGQTTLAD